ncbi:helix-turn-helix transcriptional regulator [Solirubrobacter sp. CPCC 204708]|uniref:LuxR C-terminal-related transcriptional regulator n=1 Tax=Solirubrobacter deserti TaxID=2282478 RepID=A0ABT4RNI9_9ACTN|nr:LuxR C-terminal-related transcriptional regulator [Solirubrobacter deserti]MBE2320135.1 helix-turn-helix transcriptional regulator [Solirubrobacter deserti]MDA0139855.1 LuxR C-terminal-related transcriptional regulator [Solirubrobacter deserti]
MPDGARPLAEAVAILGEGAGAGLAARLAGLDHGAMGAAEEALVRAGILEGDSGLTFTHPLVRTTVLAGMSASRRERHHAAAYAVLAERGAHPEELATHALHIEPARDPERVAILRAAAERARVLGAPATAAAYLRRALAEPPPPELRCEVLTELGHAEARAGLGEATEHLRIAVAEASAPAARARAALELARALKFGGDAVRAVDVLEAVPPALDDPELRELVELELIGLAYISRGARERLAGRIAGLRDPGHAPQTRLEAFLLAGMAFDAGAGGLRPAAETAGLAVRSVAGDLMPVDAREGGYGMLVAGVAAMWADRLDDASRINARMLDEARRRGSVILRVSAASMQALVNWRRGRISDADADSALALELARDAHGADALVPAARAVKALIALARDTGRDELARIEAETLDGDSDPDALPYHLLLHARGLLRLAQGAHEPGTEDLLECGRISLAWGAGNPSVVPWRSDAALALARAGARRRAARLAAEELELAERFGTPRAIGVAQRAVALVADDDSTLPGLERAVATLTDSPALLELATATTDLAHAQRRAGQKTGARETAALAQELAVRAGATALARRAREEALASGARPRRVARSGVGSLTPSELRVAQRAAEGHSNREIAEDLFVTVKTVEMHLAKAYAKLGIRSRTELADALAETAMTAR